MREGWKRGMGERGGGGGEGWEGDGEGLWGKRRHTA